MKTISIPFAATPRKSRSFRSVNSFFRCIDDPEIDGKPDSGYEAIFHDDANDIFYVVHEAAPVEIMRKKKSRYHVIVEEVRISGNEYTNLKGKYIICTVIYS